MRIIAIIIIITFSINLVGCARAFKPQAGPLWQQDLLHNTPPGPENFRRGWVDGCETGISSSGNHMQKFFYKFKQNYELSQNNEYYTGWKVAFDFCQRFMFQYLKRSEIGL